MSIFSFFFNLSQSGNPVVRAVFIDTFCAFVVLFSISLSLQETSFTILEFLTSSLRILFVGNQSESIGIQSKTIITILTDGFLSRHGSHINITFRSSSFSTINSIIQTSQSVESQSKSISTHSTSSSCGIILVIGHTISKSSLDTLTVAISEVSCSSSIKLCISTSCTCI